MQNLLFQIRLFESDVQTKKNLIFIHILPGRNLYVISP